MAHRRPRTTANLEVPQLAYRDAVAAWLGAPLVAALPHMCGPRYIVDLRASTPYMATSLLPLFHKLADEGATSGALQARGREFTHDPCGGVVRGWSGGGSGVGTS